MRFKQICNHPAQLLGDGHSPPKRAASLPRLGEICEEIASRQEKVLVFTQFREMADPLSGFLAKIFGRAGLVLHGGTAVGRRKHSSTNSSATTGRPSSCSRSRPAARA